jgi:hypothetical protein
VTREEEGNWNIWHKKMQELNPNTSENYLLNSTRVCVCHHSSPSLVMNSKQCSYIFTAALSFMACKGTVLTSSSLGYRNLNWAGICLIFTWTDKKSLFPTTACTKITTLS